MAALNKTALVTGSTSGIGLSIAHTLAKRGVNVIISGFGDENEINKIVADIKGYGVRADYVPADLSKVMEIDALWLKVIEIYPDGIDILVNNAGLIHYCPIENLPDEKWDQQIAVILSASFHLIKRSVPLMRKKGWGRIVNIASLSALVARPMLAAYTAAKHGLVGLTKSVALETASGGITCNAVCPAGVKSTSIFNSLRDTLAADFGITPEEFEKQSLSEVLTGQYIEPGQVAELVEFLCLSNASSQITGSAYTIDQGYTAH